MWDARGYKAPSQAQLSILIGRCKYALGKETLKAANDMELATIMGVSLSTFKRWKYNAHTLPYWAFKALKSITGDNNAT